MTAIHTQLLHKIRHNCLQSLMYYVRRLRSKPPPLVRISAGARYFLFFKTSRPALRPTQSPIKWVPEFFRKVKQPGRDVDHSPPPSAAIKNEWSYTSAPPICLQSVKKQFHLVKTNREDRHHNYSSENMLFSSSSLALQPLVGFGLIENMLLVDSKKILSKLQA